MLVTGSNFGYAVKYTSNSRKRAAIVGPAPDWALGSRNNPVLEFDVLVDSTRTATRRSEGGTFAAVECVEGRISQQWTLSPGVLPRTSNKSNVKMAAPGGGCWEIEGCSTGEGASVNCNWGCKG